MVVYFQLALTGSSEPHIVVIQFQKLDLLLSEEGYLFQDDVLRFLLVHLAHMKVIFSHIMRSNHQVVVSFCQNWAHVKLFAIISVWGPELYFKKHVVNVVISAFGQDDDVASVDHELLDLTHIAWNLLLVLKNYLLVLLNDEVFAYWGRFSTAKYSVGIGPVLYEF